MNRLQERDFEQAALQEFVNPWSLVDLMDALRAYGEPGAMLGDRLREAQDLIAKGHAGPGCFVSAATRQNARRCLSRGYELRAEALVEAARILRQMP